MRLAPQRALAVPHWGRLRPGEAQKCASRAFNHYAIDNNYPIPIISWMNCKE